MRYTAVVVIFVNVIVVVVVVWALDTEGAAHWCDSGATRRGDRYVLNQPNHMSSEWYNALHEENNRTLKCEHRSG